MIGTRWQNYDFYPRPPKFLTTNVCIFQILVVSLQKDKAESNKYHLNQSIWIRMKEKRYDDDINWDRIPVGFYSANEEEKQLLESKRQRQSMREENTLMPRSLTKN